MAMKNRQEQQHGFTIVELLIVIVTISILATIVLVSYGNWRTSVATDEVENNLKQADAAMENVRNFTGSYPTSALPSTFTPNSDVTLQLKNATTSSFCIQGTSTVIPTVVYAIQNDSTEPSAGTC